VPADLGQLIFLCGGDEEVFEVVKDGLDAMGKVTIGRL
jgi:3-hydroxyisobutyrate dehydrogenase-like beta-hydroxyacid dehydrogenase